MTIASIGEFQHVCDRHRDPEIEAVSLRFQEI
jgi:hypothetical protein